MPKSPAEALGEYIRHQRELQELSMRQFAAATGISNPYLSQIERGLRAPSDAVLKAIAESLRTTAEGLLRQAGIAPEAAGESPVVEAIRADQRLTAAQRRTVLEVYRAFTK